jgi:hypothetical protein
MIPSHIWRRLLQGVAVAFLLVFASLASAVAAQAALPMVSVALSPSSITVSGAPQSGAVNIVSTAVGGFGEVAAYELHRDSCCRACDSARAAGDRALDRLRFPRTEHTA